MFVIEDFAQVTYENSDKVIMYMFAKTHTAIYANHLPVIQRISPNIDEWDLYYAYCNLESKYREREWKKMLSKISIEEALEHVNNAYNPSIRDFEGITTHFLAAKIKENRNNHYITYER